jgi:hypothetical protein
MCVNCGWVGEVCMPARSAGGRGKAEAGGWKCAYGLACVCLQRKVGVLACMEVLDTSVCACCTAVCGAELPQKRSGSCIAHLCFLCAGGLLGNSKHPTDTYACSKTHERAARSPHLFCMQESHTVPPVTAPPAAAELAGSTCAPLCQRPCGARGM